MNENARLVILISGSGSNLQAIIDAVSGGELAANLVAVISNRKAAYGLVRATMADIPTIYFPLKPYRDAGRSRADYDADLAQQIKSLKPDLIVLAGWMHVLDADFISQFPEKMINLHPALPGQFNGTHAIERAFAAYQRGEIDYSGCIVHYVIPAVDEGPVIDQMTVPFQPNDTVDSFAKRLHAAEHNLLIKAIKKIV